MVSEQWNRREVLAGFGAASLAAGSGIVETAAAEFADPAHNPAIPDAAVSAFRARLGGSLIAAGEPFYEQWRRSMIWQLAKARRHPQFIVQAETVDDVIEAVRFAAEHGLRLTTRVGGHSMAASFLRNDGILLDLSRLNRIIAIDPKTRSAIVEPGMIGRGLVEALLEHGLAFPVAHCGMVPISGFLLGGGMGLNCAQWGGGMSVFAVRGVDIVTADGMLRHASSTENPDLFWAARGAGPGLFGVVTRFYLECFAAPKAIHGFTYNFELADMPAAAARLDVLVRKLDPRIEILALVVHVAGDDGTGHETGKRVFQVDASIFVDTPEEARRLLAPLLEDPILSRAVERDEGRVWTFDDYFNANEAGFPQTYWMGDNLYIDDLPAAAKVLAAHLADCPTPHSTPLFQYKLNAPYPDASCSTDGRYYFAFYMEWSDPALESSCRAYVNRVISDLKPLSSGSYINEMDQEGRRSDIQTCFSAEAWARLSQMRRKWDASGVFHDFLGFS